MNPEIILEKLQRAEGTLRVIDAIVDFDTVADRHRIEQVRAALSAHYDHHSGKGSMNHVKYKPGAFPKRCKCGQVYQTADEWQELTFGYFHDSTMNGKRYHHDLECRECRCHSHICVPVERGDQ